MFNIDVHHLLCIWYIDNDVENMVDNLCGGKRNQQGQVFRKVDGTPWLKVLHSMNLRRDGNRLWLPGRLGTERSFDTWLEHGFHLKRNLCVHGRMTVYTWVIRLPAELKANTRL